MEYLSPPEIEALLEQSTPNKRLSGRPALFLWRSINARNTRRDWRMIRLLRDNRRFAFWPDDADVRKYLGKETTQDIVDEVSRKFAERLKDIMVPQKPENLRERMARAAAKSVRNLRDR